MDNYVTQQLMTEIQKLKERDYTSYQNFYNQTAQYLYGVIMETVQEQEAANVLINDLYTDIYSSIGTELTDNTQFYSWAANKAQTLSNTYLMTHILPVKKEDDKSNEVAAMAMGAVFSTTPGTAAVEGAANVGGDVAAWGTMNAGMSQSASGTMSAGMSQSAWGTMNAGMSRSASETMSAGMGHSVSGTMNHNTLINTDSQMANQATEGFTNAGGGAVSTATKTGMSLAAKVAIGVTSAAVVLGVGISIITNINKDKDETSETTEIVSSIEDTEEVTGTVAEEVIDPEIAERAAAYYELIVEEDGSMPINEYYSPSKFDDDYDPYALNVELKYTDIMLVDFNGDGKKQLVTVTNRYTDTYGVDKYVRVYDFIEGNVNCIFEVGYVNIDYNFTASNQVRSRVYLITAPDGQVSIEVANPNEGGSVVDYVYDNGSMVAVNTSEFDYNLGYQMVDPGEGYYVECIADDGGSPTGALYYDLKDNRDTASVKMKYDAIVEELSTLAGIDTSNVWKSVYAKKIQQLSDASGYKFSLQDMNGDGIPELIGIFNGGDTGNSFAITCSKYGTYDYITLTYGSNYFDTDNGRIHTFYYDDTESDVAKSMDDRVYVIDKGCFIMVGNYEQYRMSGELIEEWLWCDYNADSNQQTPLSTISANEYNLKAEAFVSGNDFESTFSYVTTSEEISSAIEKY